jgi:predicted exporter/ubiquinone/menaquinone biosynthesis C-methylase UbiE
MRARKEPVMSCQKFKIRWFFGITVISVVSVLFITGKERIKLATDITASLPDTDPVLADARFIIANHPLQDRVAIDLKHTADDISILIEGGESVEKMLQESGLFKSVGLKSQQQLFPEFLSYIITHLPVLFSERELQEKIYPLISTNKVRESIANNFSQLADLEGIGQANLIAHDPLGFRNIILQKLSSIVPSKNAVIVQKYLISQDKKHLLVMAESVTSSFDTTASQNITTLMNRISEEINKEFAGRDSFSLTPVGAYRAALDNETMAKKDARTAVLFSTIAILILLLIGFPRPLIGILALLPAVAGTMMSLFVYSLFQSSISLMAIGFGGAIISFTVDYGIAYLLFLDRPYETYGLEATKEIWSLGLLAMLTTAVSFAFLFVADFPALTQLGLFSALGVVFTYIFVHAIYPFTFPVVPAAKKNKPVLLQKIVDRISSSKSDFKLYAAAAIMAFMVLFLRFDFRVKLDAMNTVTPETLAAENLIKDKWGDVFIRIYLGMEGESPDDLQKNGDKLSFLIENEMAEGAIASAFTPSMIFPGHDRTRKNFTEWKAFWNPDRVSELKQSISVASQEIGFTPEAFIPFFKMLESKEILSTKIPKQFYNFLGISKQDNDKWILFSTMIPGSAYNAENFRKKVTSTGTVKMFDPAFFSERLGDAFFHGFIKVALIVGIITLLVSLLYLFDWRLTLVALLPTLFSLICSIGTLNVIGQPLGLPLIMVSVIIIGMGTDYALYLVRAYQRYREDTHPSVGLIRLSVFLSFSTTFFGFGILALSGHSLLQDAGIALALGIGYSYLGTVMIVPPLVRRLMSPATFPEEKVTPGSKIHFERVMRRYRHMEAYPRLFARFKIKLDPMFPRLADFLDSPRIIIDIGTGYGVPAVWLLELFPKAYIYGIEPDPRRAHFASWALGRRGIVEVGRAPNLPSVTENVDAVIMIDMIHYLTDSELRTTLKRLHKMVRPGGTIIVRATVPSLSPVPWWRRIEELRLKFKKTAYYFRKSDEIIKILSETGFMLKVTEPARSGREEIWFVSASNESSPPQAAG